MTQLNIQFQNIINLLCGFQIILFVFNLLYGPYPYLYILAAITPVNILLAIYTYRHGFILRNAVFILTALLALLIFTILSPAKDDYKYLTLLIGVSAFFISLILNGKSALNLIFYLNLLLNIIVFKIGLQNGFDVNFGNNILFNASRNMVSSYLIVSIIYYLFFSFKYNEKINIFLVSLFFVNSLILYGRSGIALGSMILIYSLYKRFGKSLFLILSVILLSSISTIYMFILEKTNFSEGLESPRTAMFNEYITDPSLQDIIFGREIAECCATISLFDNNPHNSFIFAHINYGIPSIILFLLIFITILKTKEYELIFFIIVLYIRYSLDVMGAFLFSDVVIFSIFIYAFRYLKDKNHSSKLELEYK